MTLEIPNRALRRLGDCKIAAQVCNGHKAFEAGDAKKDAQDGDRLLFYAPARVNELDSGLEFEAFLCAFECSCLVSWVWRYSMHLRI